MIGLAMVNIFQPGAGLAAPVGADTSQLAALAQNQQKGWDIFLHLFPTSVIDSMAKGDILQMVVFATFFGVRRLVRRDSRQTVAVAAVHRRRSWHELAREIARLLDRTPSLVAVKVADVPMKAKRPQYCALSNCKLAEAGVTMPAWQDSLARYLDVVRRR